MTTVANATTPFVFNGRIIRADLNANVKTANNLKQSTLEFLGAANGAFRCLQLIERTTKIVIEALKWTGRHTVGFAEKFAAKAMIGWTALTLPRLPAVTVDAIKAVNALSEKITRTSAEYTRAVVKAVHNVAEMAAMYGYGLSFITGSMSAKIAADVPDLITQVTDAHEAGTELQLANDAISKVPQGMTDVRERLVHTQRFTFMKLVKSVCSIATGVLGLSLLTFGAPVVPSIVMITISLTSTIFAIASQLYKDSNRYKMVDFFENRAIAL